MLCAVFSFNYGTGTIRKSAFNAHIVLSYYSAEPGYYSEGRVLLPGSQSPTHISRLSSQLCRFRLPDPRFLLFLVQVQLLIDTVLGGQPRLHQIDLSHIARCWYGFKTAGVPVILAPSLSLVRRHFRIVEVFEVLELAPEMSSCEKASLDQRKHHQVRASTGSSDGFT